MENRFFQTRTKSYSLTTEKTQSDLIQLAKISVTIPKPYFTTEFSFHNQFNNQFEKGAVNGVFIRLEPKDKNSNELHILLTLTLNNNFGEADKTFRDTVSLLKELTLREKDDLIKEYDKCLKEHGIYSTYSKQTHSKQDHDNYDRNEYAY